jgi:hypothetical protein
MALMATSSTAKTMAKPIEDFQRKICIGRVILCEFRCKDLGTLLSNSQFNSTP